MDIIIIVNGRVQDLHQLAFLLCAGLIVTTVTDTTCTLMLLKNLEYFYFLVLIKEVKI